MKWLRVSEQGALSEQRRLGCFYAAATSVRRHDSMVLGSAWRILERAEEIRRIRKHGLALPAVPPSPCLPRSVKRGATSERRPHRGQCLLFRLPVPQRDEPVSTRRHALGPVTGCQSYLPDVVDEATDAAHAHVSGTSTQRETGMSTRRPTAVTFECIANQDLEPCSTANCLSRLRTCVTLCCPLLNVHTTQTGDTTSVGHRHCRQLFESQQ